VDAWTYTSFYSVLPVSTTGASPYLSVGLAMSHIYCWLPPSIGALFSIVFEIPTAFLYLGLRDEAARNRYLCPRTRLSSMLVSAPPASVSSRLWDDASPVERIAGDYCETGQAGRSPYQL
jgi:hypothetical protein